MTQMTEENEAIGTKENIDNFCEIQKESPSINAPSYKTAKEGMDRIEAWAEENGVLYKRTSGTDHASGTFAIYDRDGKYAGDAIYGWFAEANAEKPFEVSENLSRHIGDVEGYLTADEVIERFAKQIEKERDPKVEEAYETMQKAGIDALTVNSPEFVHGGWQFTLVTEMGSEITYDGKGELWLKPDDEAVNRLYDNFENASLEPCVSTRLCDIDPEELSALGDPDIFQVRFTLEEKEQGLSGSEREITDGARPFGTPERDKERGPREEDEEELA